MRFWANLFLLVALLVVAGFSAAPTQAVSPADQTVAIVGVDVLPMTGTERLRDQTVLIAGGRITAMGPRNRVAVPSGARRIAGSGLTLMPGLVDMHVHLAPTPGEPGDPAQRALAVMLGHGTTTARGMAGSPQNLAVREAIEKGRIAGPRFYAAAPGLHVQNTPTAEAARTAVAQAKASGFDLIKSHHLTDVAVWQAVQEEASRQGLPTAGHVTNQVGLDRAIAAGQQIEHLDSVLFELLAAGAPERAIEFGQIPPPPVIRALANVSQAQIDALARRVAAARSHHVPTLSLFEKIVDLEKPTEALARAPEMRFVPDQSIAQWSAQREQMKQAGFTPADAAVFRDLRRRIVAAFHKAGVPVMAGSDTAQSFHIWGPGLIDEIEALAAAGLTPMDALRAATVVPRDYLRSLPNGGSELGWKADFGTVEKGARADLILLRGDPSRDLKALRALDTVIAGGRVYDRAALDAMLDKAAADAKKQQQAAAPAKQVYVMRHLHTPAGAQDPDLTAEGQAGAQRLAEFLSNAEIKAIFVTDTKRARQTAAPLAAKLGITPTVYDPSNPAALTAAAGAAPGNVLIVGHSNTVPDIVERLGGARPAPLTHNDFGMIWRVDGGAKLVREFPLSGPAPAALRACENPNFPAGSRCGTVRVPENRQLSAGRMIDIHFAVVPATGNASDAPLVSLPGGPGLGGVQSGPGTAQLFGSMRENRDLLLIDQRGTGASNPLACAQSDGLETDAKAAAACRDVLATKADLGRYVTREAVLDMEAIRAALGYPQLDLFGMSYGTRLALDYLRLFPQRVGQTVIRAAAPVSMKLPLHTPRDTQIAFDRVVAACLAQPECATRHPNLAEQMRQIVNRLRKSPAPYAVTDPKSGERSEKSLDLDKFGSTMFFLLYIEDFYVQIPPLIDQAAKGNFSPLMQAVAPFTEGTVSAIAWGLRWSVICDEDVRRIAAREIGPATQGSFMGAAAVRKEVENCAVWPKAAVPADFLQPVSSDKPVFIISGEMDPVAGKRWGDDIARTLPNSLHIEVPGASHLPPLPGCTGELVKAFLNGAPLSSLDTRCAASRERPRFKVAA